MKRITALFLASAFLTASASRAAEDWGNKDDKKKKRERTSGRSEDPVRQAPGVRPVKERPAPAVRPEQAPKQESIPLKGSDQGGNQRRGQRPLRVQDPINRSSQPSRAQAPRPQRQAPAVRESNQTQAPAVRQANEVRRRANAREDVRKKLSRIGVKAEPRRITDHSKIISTNRANSTIRYPKTGIRGEALRGSLVSPRNFNNRVVRDQMAVVNRPAYAIQIEREKNSENRRNHTYWHEGRGFNYAHHIDRGGYHWYGWYRGDQYFWTRHYNGRWWWYDTDYDRWCFYDSNYWWWQDPYDEENLYYYDNDNYVSLYFSAN